MPLPGRFVAFCTVAALSSSLLAVAPAASAAPAADKPGTIKIVLYAENRGLSRVDVNKPGTDNGDLVHRELALSSTMGGPVIGVSYTQAETIAYNADAKVEVRRVDSEKVLPGGVLYSEGISRLVIGTLPQPGWADTYAVIGGTGKYAGARGTERLTLLEDGKTFKVVLTLMK